MEFFSREIGSRTRLLRMLASGARIRQFRKRAERIEDLHLSLDLMRGGIRQLLQAVEPSGACPDYTLDELLTAFTWISFIRMTNLPRRPKR
jgi:hypothetical protein